MYARSTRVLWVLIAALAAQLAFGQSEIQKRTLVVNGHSGEIIVYRIDGKAFVSLEELTHIANGSLNFQGSEIVVALPAASAGSGSHASAQDDPALSRDFMGAAIQSLGDIKEWHTTIAHALQRGIPGDGSGLVGFHDRAATSLQLATVAARNTGDRDALQLLTNHFNHVDTWAKQVIQERRSMNTAKYSMSPESLEKDPQYHAIGTCSRFLGTMLASGRYQDERSCH
jgi:hypothetical protein